MLTKTKIAFAALALLTVAGTSATLASDHEDQSGGFVMSGSMDGVNPVFHPEWFGSRANGSGHINGRGAFASTRRSKAGRARGQDAFGLASRP